MVINFFRPLQNNQNVLIMKKKHLFFVIVAIAMLAAGFLELLTYSATASQPTVNCDGQVSGIDYICTNESTEKCTYVDGDLNGHTMCYGKLYLNY